MTYAVELNTIDECIAEVELPIAPYPGLLVRHECKTYEIKQVMVHMFGNLSVLVTEVPTPDWA